MLSRLRSRIHHHSRLHWFFKWALHIGSECELLVHVFFNDVRCDWLVSRVAVWGSWLLLTHIISGVIWHLSAPVRNNGIRHIDQISRWLMAFITKAFIAQVLKRHSFLPTMRWIVSDRVERIVCRADSESITNWIGGCIWVWSYRPLEGWHPVEIVGVGWGRRFSAIHFCEVEVGFAEWLVLLNNVTAIRHNHGSVTIWNVCRSTTKRHPLVLIGGRIVVLSQSEHHIVLNCCRASVAALVAKSNIQQATIALFNKSFIVSDRAWQECIDSGRPVLDRHIFQTLCSLVLVLATFYVNNCLRFIWVEWFQIEELFREVWHTI